MPTTITPHLWFADDLFVVIDFYLDLFPGSQVHARTEMSPGVRTAEFTLCGQRLMAIEAAHPGAVFDDSFSMFVSCPDQAEVDRIWDRLAEGGTPQRCGWITDRWGLRWQVVPTRLGELQADPNPERAAAALAAMMTMVKLDVAALEAAADSAGR